MNQAGRLIHLADVLAALVKIGPRSVEDLDVWYKAAHAAEDQLVQPGGGAENVPHFLWHYLSDGDIRVRDREYSEMQERRILKMIDSLRAGRMPSDEEI